MSGSITQIMQRQWSGYPRYHRARFNLALHIAVVPVFVLANIGMLVALSRGAWLAAGACLVTTVVSIALQGKGHARESVPPEPFTGAYDAVARIFLEQWVTFPRFVVSGGWAKAWRESGKP